MVNKRETHSVFASCVGVDGQAFAELVIILLVFWYLGKKLKYCTSITFLFWLHRSSFCAAL